MAKRLKPQRREVLSLMLGASAAAAAPTLSRATTEKTKPNRVCFALFADNPYSDQAEDQVREAMERASSDAEFFIHVGDIKGGGESCDDGLLARRLALLQQAPRPLILTPGDNEWTDCHRVVAGSYDPLERLQWLRSAAFDREQSLGAVPMAIRSQTAGRLLPSPLTAADIDQQGMPENQAWQAGPAQFVSLSVTGSAHGFSAGLDETIIAAHARANRRWLTQALESAIDKQLAVLVVICHAEFAPAKLSSNDRQSADRDRARPYGWLRAALHETVVRFPGTVMLLNGDTHAFALDNPWRSLMHRGQDSALPSYEIAEAQRHLRMNRFVRVRGIGAPAAGAYVGIEITQPANRMAPIDVTVTPRLL